MHWSEFIGGDVVISPPYQWQLRYNASDVEVISRIDKPVNPDIIQQLIRKFPDFCAAYGETPMDFDTYPCTVRTLRQFIAACGDLNAIIRNFLLPNPE